MKTKESISAYNKEYFSRPEVIAKAKERNAKYRERRKLYKKTVVGRDNENKYRRKKYTQTGFEKHIWARYKLTRKDYHDLVFSQGGFCAICETFVKLHVDHCHKTNKVRGLLCGKCNRALGLFNDDTESLKRAIKYLKVNGI